MSDYQLTWITDQLAVGHAPMSYDDLGAVKTQGVDVIVNLCGEFCDLHEIEERSGFEVFYLPIPDECAPDMEEMEKALAWLDEAIYLGKKALVHCRHGIGRTGTFVTSYLLRRGLGLKKASKKLKQTRIRPVNYCQWQLLKRYQKKEGILKFREPSLEPRRVVDLSAYFAEYETLIRKIDEAPGKVRATKGDLVRCGLESNACCFNYLDLQLIEAISLSSALNRTLKSDLRMELIHQAVAVNKKIKKMSRNLAENSDNPGNSKKSLTEIYALEKILCPLNQDLKCVLFEYRPIQCRLYGIPDDAIDTGRVKKMLFDISRNVFFAFSGFSLENLTLTFSLAEAVSGRFVQKYFDYMMSLRKEHRT